MSVNQLVIELINEAMRKDRLDSEIPNGIKATIKE